jgi:hypothetical protein
MLTIFEYDQIATQLADSFANRYKRNDVNITGVLLARPQHEFAKKETLPHLDFWHYRSDSYTEFFCVGYTDDVPEEDRKAEVVARVGGKEWYFSPKAFIEIVNRIQRETSWRYDDECYLLITNCRFDRSLGRAWLDFEGSMVVNLGQAVKDKAIPSATYLADLLFEFAKNINEDDTDPVWVLSDKLGVRVLKKSLFEYLLSWFPSAMKKGTKQAIHFVTKDLRPLSSK